MSIKHKADSFRGAVAITPNDSNDLTDAVSALYIGVTGAVKVTTASNETVTFVAVAVGILPIAVKKVFATGTAALSIIGLK